MNITSETMRSMEQVVEQKSELMKMKDQGISTLTQIIQKRKQIQEHLSLLRKSIQLTENKVKKLEDDNSLILAKLTSILELNKQHAKTPEVSVGGKKHLFTSELLSIVEDFNPDDTIEILKYKMKKTLDVYDGYLEDATSISSNYDRLENMKITILNSERVAPILTLDLTKENRNKQDVILLSHSILSLLDNQSFLLASALTALPRSVNSSSSFVLGHSIFVLKYYWTGFLVDELLIQPCTTFDKEFIQKLGSSCYKSPKKLLNSSIKVCLICLLYYCTRSFLY